jgi:holo-[acyl-carrier protein] synthase
MSIIGIGVDVVDIDRFVQTLERTPNLRTRLFTEDERKRPSASLAARFAAKEAIAKALGAPVGMGWHDAEIVTDDAGAPSFVIRGTVQARADELGVRTVHVSMSHDAGIASAFVLLED